MKRLYNPYRKLEGYNCFGCSPDNPIGLKLNFFEDGEKVISNWSPSMDYQGYFHILHGGIQATMMDEIASWVVLVKVKTAGVTSRLNCKYIKSVEIDKGAIRLEAKLREMKRNLAYIDVSLFDGEGTLCASAEAVYFTFPEEVARKKLHFPKIEEFYEE